MIPIRHNRTLKATALCSTLKMSEVIIHLLRIYNWKAFFFSWGESPLTLSTSSPHTDTYTDSWRGDLCFPACLLSCTKSHMFWSNHDVKKTAKNEWPRLQSALLGTVPVLWVNIGPYFPELSVWCIPLSLNSLLMLEENLRFSKSLYTF